MWHSIKVLVALVTLTIDGGLHSQSTSRTPSTPFCPTDVHAQRIGNAEASVWASLDEELSTAQQVWHGSELLQTNQGVKSYPTVWWIDSLGKCQMQTLL